MNAVWCALGAVGVLAVLFGLALGKTAQRADERLAHMDFDRHTDDALHLVNSLPDEPLSWTAPARDQLAQQRAKHRGSVR